MRYKLGIDAGGTFTDYVALDSQGKTLQSKVLSDYANPVKSVLQGLDQLASVCGLKNVESLLRKTDSIVHGTTLTLNGLLEQKGAKTALLTTAGFRDALEIRRSKLKNQWDLQDSIPPLLVPRYLRIGVEERLNHAGEIITPLVEKNLEEIATFLVKEKVESLAVCFLFSYLNPVHEKMIKTFFQNRLPELRVSLSSEIAPRIKEYERTVTTVLDAYLGPMMDSYSSEYKELLQENGYQGPLAFILNHGGISSLKNSSALGVKTLLSGPAGGSSGGKRIFQNLQCPNLVVADMGGTSFDVHLISSREGLVSGAEIVGYPVALPVVDIHSVGAGGGSIAFLNESLGLEVGPCSAGSFPGPAVYGQGGTEPTVTDALAILGLIDPKYFSQGKIVLDMKAGEEAIYQKIAQPLGISSHEAAIAIYKIIAAKMADAVRLITIQKGYDPRESILLAAGGAFPLFAAEIMDMLKMKAALIPIQGPVFCAWGMLNSLYQEEVVKNFLRTEKSFKNEELLVILEQMAKKGSDLFLKEGFTEESISFEPVIEMRYLDQHHEISLSLGKISKLSFTKLDISQLGKKFHAEHKRLYGYCQENSPWTIVNLRLSCYVDQPELSLPIYPCGFKTGEAKTRKVIIDILKEKNVPVYKKETLLEKIEGPALIDQDFTTIYIPEGFEVELKAIKGYWLLKKVKQND